MNTLFFSLSTTHWSACLDCGDLWTSRVGCVLLSERSRIPARHSSTETTKLTFRKMGEFFFNATSLLIVQHCFAVRGEV
jgi:hypothetical protein